MMHAAVRVVSFILAGEVEETAVRQELNVRG